MVSKITQQSTSLSLEVQKQWKDFGASIFVKNFLIVLGLWLVHTWLRRSQYYMENKQTIFMKKCSLRLHLNNVVTIRHLLQWNLEQLLILKISTLHQWIFWTMNEFFLNLMLFGRVDERALEYEHNIAISQ